VTYEHTLARQAGNSQAYRERLRDNASSHGPKSVFAKKLRVELEKGRKRAQVWYDTKGKAVRDANRETRLRKQETKDSTERAARYSAALWQ